MKLYIAAFHHRHGEDVYPFFQDSEPAEDAVIARINQDSEWEGEEREEWIEVFGPYAVPVEISA